MRLFIATFLILVFAANQSFAAICVETCRLAASKIKIQTVDSSEASHDCHNKKSGSEDSKQIPAEKNCNSSFCVGAVFKAHPLAEQQVDKKQVIKRILISSNLSTPELPLFVRNNYFVRSRAPAYQKIQLHLLLQQFLI